MTHTLSHDEYHQLLECIGELHRCRSLDEFPAHALQALGPLVPSTLAAFNEVNVARERILAVTDRPVPDHDRLAETWARYSAQHPLVRYAAETGDGQAVKLSDFLTEAEFHRLELYRKFFRLVGAEDQMAVALRSDKGIIIALAFNRDRRDFTESDRVKLNLVRPHLLQAYTNVEELAGQREERADLQTALRETGHGLVAVDTRGRTTHATPGAVECLARYFPEATPAASVPSPIVDWLEADPITSFTLHTAASTLIVRRPRHTARRLLLISEKRGGPDAGHTSLSAREREVLTWMAESKSNAEIAAILDIASGTVKRHVEQILAKLQVANRTAAAAVARNRGLVASR